MVSGRRGTILMVAYHIPPFTGSSGVQRTVKFCRYLREFGWQPVVLTVTPRAYVTSCDRDNAELPDDVPVYRSFCLDTARHLSLIGRYPELLALPDRWVSWWPSGVLRGLKIVREWQPDVVWSTYPVATAHLIAGALSRMHDLPWVADFRDWMTEGDYPARRLQRWAYRRVERFVLKNATAANFTTESCRDFYVNRYPALANGNWAVLPNGYDETDFTGLDVSASQRREDEITLLHSGYLYPQDRSPAGLFKAIADLQQRSFFEGRKFKVRFRAPGDEAHVQQQAARFGVTDFVEVAPPVSHRAALQEMLEATSLLLMQGPRFDRQVPAKAYEYLRSGRPVLTLASKFSESARLMADYGSPYIAEIDSSAEIAVFLERLILDIEANQTVAAHRGKASRFDRRSQTGFLADVLGRVAESDTVFAQT